MARQGKTICSCVFLFALATNNYVKSTFPFEKEVNVCTTPTKQLGDCRSIKNCSVLVELLRQNKTSAISLVKESICGFEGLNSLVCCPVLSHTSGSPQESPLGGGNGSSTVYNKAETVEAPCGQIYLGENKITGGTNATLGEWPWIAALGYNSTQRPGIEWLCGGSLITSRHVITAAHCIRVPSHYSLVLVRLGDLNLDDKVDDGASPVDIEVDKVLPHPNFDDKRKVNDIAIIRLRKAVQFSELIRPICLPNTPYFRSSSLAGLTATVAGWGKLLFGGEATTALQQVDLKITDDETCRNAYQSLNRTTIDIRVMCAGTAGKSACKGDSGGPLTLIQNNTVYMVGVVAYGKGCGEPGYPGVLTRVTSFVDWINTNLN